MSDVTYIPSLGVFFGERTDAGYASLNDLVASATAAGAQRCCVTKASLPLTAPLTIPSTMTLEVREGSIDCGNQANVLTILGPFIGRPGAFVNCVPTSVSFAGNTALTGQGAISRTLKVAYLSREDSVTKGWTLPGGGSPTPLSLTLPTGSNIVKIQLVCTEDQNGNNGTWVVDNGDGSKTYITKSYNDGGVAFVEEVETTLQLNEVAGQDAVVRLSYTGFSVIHTGYVAIYYC